MHLAQPARLKFDQRRGRGGRDREMARIDDAHPPARHLLRRLLVQLVAERQRHRILPPPVLLYRTRQGSFEDIQLLLRHGVEYRGGPAKVLHQHLARGVTQPVCQQERAVLAEITVVEYEQELGALGFQALDAVGNAGREEPQIAGLYIINERAALLVHRGDPRSCRQHVAPIPMRCANAAPAPHLLSDAYPRRPSTERPATPAPWSPLPIPRARSAGERR